MSSPTYIYAGTRSATLTQGLLNDTQLERLLSAKSGDEARKVLQDTFLASYLAGSSAGNVSEAVEQYVGEAKKVLAAIAPEPRVLDVLWLRYDFYNLRTVSKGVRKGTSSEDILAGCYTASTIAPEDLLRSYQENTLGRYSSQLAAAAEIMQATNDVFAIDLAADEYYFRSLVALDAELGDSFVHDYITLHIDLFNIRAALRSERLGETIGRRVFVPGGSVSSRQLESAASALDVLARFGGESYWADAVSQYRDQGSFAALDKAGQEYMLRFLKEASVDLFSPAPLYAYFSAAKNNAQVIRAIVIAKDAGIPEAELRLVLRRLYR